MRDFADITIVLDRSGSMNSLVGDVIGGYKTFIEKQKAVGDNAAVTLVQFDDQYEKVFTGVPIKNVSADLAFNPRGMTALLDAMGRTIDATGERLRNLPESQRPDKVIFVVITDGEENASREYRIERLRELVTRQQNQYNWQFIFLGANIDSFATGASLGISSFTTSNYVGTGVGIRSALYAAGTYTCSVREQGVSHASMSDTYAKAQADLEAEKNANTAFLNGTTSTGVKSGFTIGGTV